MVSAAPASSARMSWAVAFAAAIAEVKHDAAKAEQGPNAVVSAHPAGSSVGPPVDAVGVAVGAVCGGPGLPVGGVTVGEVVGEVVGLSVVGATVGLAVGLSVGDAVGLQLP